VSDAESKGGTIFEARIAVLEEIEKHSYPGIIAGSNIGTRLDALIAAVREDERKCAQKNV
jgi:hypothetical protein